jgi:Uma2 family endonuclease
MSSSCGWIAPEAGVPEALREIPPDPAVEVVSLGESAKEVREKLREYLAAGTPLVWVVYPRTREVIVHTPDGLAHTYGSAGTLEQFELLQASRAPLRNCLAEEARG